MIKKTILFLLTAALFMNGCSSEKEKIYILRGDDVGDFIFRDFIEQFNKDQRKIKFHFAGGGSQTAINAMLDETVHMIFSLKQMNNEDLALFKSKNIFPVVTPLVKIPILVIANNELPIEELSLSQIKNIFVGYNRYWWQFSKRGKADANMLGPIDFCSLDARNGEFYYIKEKFTLTDFNLDTRFMSHNHGIVDYVEQNKNAVGYISLPFLTKTEKVKMVYSKQDLEAIGYLIISKEFSDTELMKNFTYHLKTYLYKNQSVLLQKGIKVIKEEKDK